MYKTIREIDFFKDEKLRQELVKVSLAIVVVPAFVLGIFLGLSAAGSIAPFAEFDRIGVLLWVVLLMVVTAVALPAHELVHASYFKLFHPKAHIIFGFKDAMLYAGCPGEVFTHAQMVWILLAPAIELTSLFCILAFAMGVPVLCLAACVLHLSGCSGDILAVKAILTEPSCTHCEDTDFGIRLLSL